MTNNTTPPLIHWRLKFDEEQIAWLCLDKADAKVNVLSQSVLEEFETLVTALEEHKPSGVVIHSGKPNGFVMGADINEFQKIKTSDQGFKLIRLGHSVADRLEQLDCSSVAVLNGFALGGGLELALACTHRIAIETDKRIIGFPEVQLGLHPGFGGTVRSVRLAGVRAAMQLMLTGNPITPKKAYDQGLIDKIATSQEWEQDARMMLSKRSSRRRAPLIDRILEQRPFRPLIARTLTKKIAKKVKKAHYPAPYALIQLWKEHGASKAGYAAEARSFADLMVGSTSRNLVRVFFLQNRLKTQGTKTTSNIKHVHVIGAGIMGGDIAAWCALKGLVVTLQDRELKYIEPALFRAQKLFAKRIRDEEERAEASKRLSADIVGNGIPKADLIIEAIFEDMDAKKTLYAEVEKSMKKDAILATNTSSIPLEKLRTDLQVPNKFIGLHFFNPVAQLPLVEVVRCADTAQDTLDFAFSFVKTIGKLPLECRSSPGFVVNRILAPYMAEAMLMAAEGIPLEVIDQAAENFGMPMGPIELIDTVGLDVARGVSKVLSEAFNRNIPADIETMVERNELGKKTGKGFYEWRNGKPIKKNPVAALVTERLTDRLMLPLVNEATICLSEEIVKDGDLLDAGVIFGTGFAPFRGGPIHYARERGIHAT
ncbi:MAG: hypothetical protein CMO98_06545 [Woeseia sp.]|nr:hypothetical protein [Woeseia sp.]